MTDGTQECTKGLAQPVLGTVCGKQIQARKVSRILEGVQATGTSIGKIGRYPSKFEAPQDYGPTWQGKMQEVGTQFLGVFAS